MTTVLYPSPKGARPFRNPSRAAIKALRAQGNRKQARALKRAAREAELEVYQIARRAIKQATPVDKSDRTY